MCITSNQLLRKYIQDSIFIGYILLIAIFGTLILSSAIIGAGIIAAHIVVTSVLVLTFNLITGILISYHAWDQTQHHEGALLSVRERLSYGGWAHLYGAWLEPVVHLSSAILASGTTLFAYLCARNYQDQSANYRGRREASEYLGIQYVREGNSVRVSTGSAPNRASWFYAKGFGKKGRSKGFGKQGPVFPTAPATKGSGKGRKGDGRGIIRANLPTPPTSPTNSWIATPVNSRAVDTPVNSRAVEALQGEEEELVVNWNSSECIYEVLWIDIEVL